MTEDRSEAEEGRRLAASWQNRSAGRVLRAARGAMPEGESKQAAFAARLSREIGIPVSASPLSNWETGRRTVPGPVLIEAAIVSGSSFDALLASVGEPAADEWAERLGFPERVAELERELEKHGAMLAALVNRYEAMKAALVQ